MDASRYTPRQPDPTVNVSKTHPLAEAGVLMAGVSLFFLLATLVLVYLVEILILFLSPEREARMFADWRLDGMVAVVEQHEAQPALEALLDRLVAHWPENPYAYRIRVSDDPLPNAMALPGGLIVVTAGLLDLLENENELAFVLAHELGHFRNRDHMRQLGRAGLLGLLYAAAGGGTGSTFAFNVSDLALRGFNREQESDADAFGLELIALEYGHVNGAWGFFEKIGDADDAGVTLRGYLDTHPQPGLRIDALRQLARERRWTAAGPLTPLSGAPDGNNGVTIERDDE